MATIPLHGASAAGRVALVDDEDVPLVQPYQWRVHESSPARSFRYGPYAKAFYRVDGRMRWVYMHVLIMGQAGIDHADGDGLNNRRSNLRPATHSQNMANQGPNSRNTSGFKGVSRMRSKWRAVLRVNGRDQWLGVYLTPEDAARAVDAAALTAWGEYARLNFPPEE